MALVQEDHIRRETLLVHHPAPDTSGIVDVAVLMLVERDVPEVGPGHNLENSVHHHHQGRVEGPLVSPSLIAHFAVELVVGLENCVGFDRVDGSPPCLPPLRWDV